MYLRQGKWFFVPAPEVHPPLTLVLFDEPLPRECGTAHVMQFAYRRGVSWYGSAGGTQAVLDVGVFAKGAVRHPDHATLVLRGWHRVATPAPSTKTM
ncbi:MAG TPA: hypothetical protein VMB27_07715 [Solirubrobacteraceae bacterium]|nr:hypothetical protein [Solirubrobacteraceae bacterium]